MIAAFLNFSQDHVDKPEGNWKNILWMEETKVQLFGLNENAKHFVYTALKLKDLIPSVKMMIFSL